MAAASASKLNQNSTVTASTVDPSSDAAQAAQAAKENSVVLDDRVLDNFSAVDLKRSYITLGREYKNKVNTVMALQRNF